MTQEPILIVDDEPEVRASLKEVLECQGYTVETAANGEEALACLARQFFPLMVTDLKMPGGFTGLDLIAAVRHRFPDTLCILITAFATIGTSLEALKRGAYDMIEKPFRLSEMEVVLNRALEHSLLLRQVKACQEVLEDRAPKRDLDPGEGHERARDIEAANHNALAVCELTLHALEAPSFSSALDPLLDRLSSRWNPDGLACYRRGKDGILHRLALRGQHRLPAALPPPSAEALETPGYGYPEEHLLPLGKAGWLYLGFQESSDFDETDPAFLLLARHLELILRVW